VIILKLQSGGAGPKKGVARKAGSYSHNRAANMAIRPYFKAFLDHVRSVTIAVR